MIEFQGVTKRYIKQTALKDVDIQIPSGKIVGVVGENGSGKSTTLKLIAGLARPTRGRVIVDGQEVNRRSSVQIAYLSELDAFYPFYTVQETIHFFATQFPDFNREKAEEMLQFMNLDAQAKVKHLSKGNRGRLKIILVLARDVPVILMDEPLSGLDPMVRDSIIKGLVSFIDIKNQTVIITTHEVSEIEPLLDMVVAIHKGKVLKMADVEELRQEQQLSIVEWMKKVYE